MLFHYCPTQSFHSIVSNRSILLSSLTLSNDSMEGTLATSKLQKRINSISDVAERSRIAKYVEIIEKMSDGLGFCLTAAGGDQLSQWRGYADDGHGFSIGFSKGYLDKEIRTKESPYVSPISFEKVLYANAAHETEINSILQDLITAFRSQSLDTKNSEFAKLAKQLMRSRFRMKNKAFDEEKEWRLFASLIRNDRLPKQIQYRASKSCLIPYIEYKFDQPKGVIQHVFIGPKNRTSDYAVRSFMEMHGFGFVEVERSKTSYQ
jgi:Protein of unknown function (DUF2971)